MLLHANLTKIQTTDTAAEVTGLEVSVIDGPRFTVRAKTYILAQGGIEIARTLLASNDVVPTGLGNRSGTVGRYFADHIAIRPALWISPSFPNEKILPYWEEHPLEAGRFWAIVASSDDLLREEKVGGFMFHFLRTGVGPGQRSLRALGQSLGRGEMPDYMSTHVMNMLRDLDSIPDTIAQEFTGSGNVFSRDWIAPWLSIECKPNPDSRVVLVDEKDRFGIPKAGLDWQLTDAERHTFTRATELMTRELGRLGYGRIWTTLLRDDFEMPERVANGKHAISTTRMSATPETGVVDRNCRMHEVHNLYIVSSSVFPTNGYAQPTFSIVAMAIRLADHLKRQHGVSP